MLYKEHCPIDYLSHHVESFWEIENNSVLRETESFIMPPEMSYDIIVVREPISIKFIRAEEWHRLNAGIYFIGLVTQSLMCNLRFGSKIFSIRLKPFSLSNISKYPLNWLNNRITKIQDIFDINKEDMSIVSILDSKIQTRKIDLATNFIRRIIGVNYTIDQTLRSQLNYIKNHKGNLKVSSVWEKFNVSKVTLRNHFLENVGLTAKEISKIYRFNNFLALIYKNPLSSLTQLSLEAGYYDQSHFIKEFRFFIGTSPNHFLRKNYYLNLSQERIERRFSSYYAPS